MSYDSKGDLVRTLARHFPGSLWGQQIHAGDWGKQSAETWTYYREVETALGGVVAGECEASGLSCGETH